MTKTLHLEHNTVAGPDANTKQEMDAQIGHPVPLKSDSSVEGDGKVHYGHAHARTSQLYQERRAQFEMKKRLEASQAAQAQSAPQEAPAQEASESEAPAAFGTERVKELALEAVKSVVGAAKEAAHGHPIAGVRKLAGDAVSGALKVAREVTNRSGGKH